MKKKNRLLKIVISMVLSLSIFLGHIPMSFAQILQSNIDVVLPSVSIKDAINKTGEYMYKNTPDPKIGTIGGEWTVLSLARSGYNVPKEYYDKYYENVVNELTAKNGNLHSVKYTEYSRVILGLTSIGKDVTNVGGYNLLEKLADFNKVIRQGINGPIFALIALDTNNYEIPTVEGVKKQTTRDNLIEYILNKEITQDDGTIGGWALSGNTPDPDITAMALQSLAKYKDQEKVKPYIDRALDILSNIQLANGGYDSWGSLNSESIAQVIVALTALGIDPKTDSRFIKGDGNWVIPAIMEFYVEGGGFKHTLDGTVNAMATDQGAYALVAYDRFVEGKNSLYNMTDAFSEISKVLYVDKIDKSVENTVNYYKGLNHVLSWWDMLALTSAGEDIIKSSYKLPEWTSNIITTNTSVTSDAGYLLGLVSRGENPNSYTDKKVNLSKILADKQDKNGNLPGGVNSQIWGMIALEVTDEDYDREKALDSLVSNQLNNGGFAFFGNQADPDMTGMALISLSFFKGNEKADASIEKAVECLNTIQKENGTFEAYNKENSNSTAMAMTGLMSVGENLNEPKWRNIVDALMKFQIQEGVASGSYEYLIGQGSNLMATQQSLIAMGEVNSNKSLWHELDSMFKGDK
ncbi:prenyltransferase/squalene oxidase repeat-containing protein [Clostridium sp. CCUG 7971]|uniref:prenyltransferase/squalene oxidase repeat-containing protein n=1 Tax=Clostridium sp. CCUG 7971 TaxID=2811414 RepID=UPI001ABA8FE0|nr:prenyltransferase/squalene oxidase repeat-containing protein [Clostridium sp. CCUG 7971]MBO3443391.1 terpene cyclase/mutase family protein [Clostridium sp. CCUG 7971]